MARCEAGFFKQCSREAEAERCDCGCGLYLCATHNAAWLEAKREKRLYALADAQVEARRLKEAGK